MRRSLKFFVTLSLTVSLLVAGAGHDCRAADPVSFETAYGAMQFTYPPGWFQNPEQHPYDLQCFAPDEQMNTGVFVYLKADLAADVTPHAILDSQVDDLRSKRRKFTELVAENRVAADGKTLTSVAYTGEKGLSRYVYRFTLIEFDDDPSQIAVALQVAIPGRWQASAPVLDAITRSVRSLN
jgi:hypothetical protein